MRRCLPMVEERSALMLRPQGEEAPWAGKISVSSGRGEEFFVEALVEHGGEFLRGVVAGEIGAAYVADEEGVAGEDGSGMGGGSEVGEDGADAFDGVAGSVEEVEARVAELESVAVFDGGVGEGRHGRLRRDRCGRRCARRARDGRRRSRRGGESR